MGNQFAGWDPQGPRTPSCAIQAEFPVAMSRSLEWLSVPVRLAQLHWLNRLLVAE